MSELQEPIYKNRVELQQAQELADWKAMRANLDAKIAERERAAEAAKPKDVQVFPYDAAQVDSETLKRTPSPAAKLFESRPATDPISNPDGRGWTEDHFLGIQRAAILARISSGTATDEDFAYLEQIRTTTGR